MFTIESLSLLMAGFVPGFNNYLSNYIFGVKVAIHTVGGQFHRTGELLTVLITNINIITLPGHISQEVRTLPND